MKRPTLAEIRRWPATCNVESAAQAMGCSRGQLYELIRRGESPVKTLQFGRRRAVITSDLVRLLEGG